MVKEETIFVDSTHIKAYANKRNVHNEFLQENYTKYAKELHRRDQRRTRSQEGKAPEIDLREDQTGRGVQRRSRQRNVSQGREGTTARLQRSNRRG
ncbi:MAG: hypothetical protein MZU97_16640 [Bacillus subtilis]|nr:hypothetical protein [Bacillus subtilis]